MKIPPQVLDSFQFIRFSSRDIDASLIPDFMLIGPNRTGSTWLHSQLARHPELHFATPKEIHYFDPLNLPSHPLHKSDDLVWYLDHFRRTPQIVEERSRQCRQDFGLEFAPRLQGEASASYAAGIGERITDLVKLNPRLKAIVLLRHPVDRVWSHLRFDARMLHGRDPLTLTEDELRMILRGDAYLLDCGRYSRILALWERHLVQGHVLPVVFDRLASDFVPLLREIARFLGVSDAPELFDEPNNYGIEKPDPPMPASLRSELTEVYRDELAFLRDRFGVGWR
jgi:hypothetical protein